MPRLRTFACLAAALASLLGWPSRAVAAGTCQIYASTALAFGAYDAFATTDDDTSGWVFFGCSGGAAPRITIGRGASSSFFPRRMSGGTDTLQYNVYLDAARTQVWGDGSGGTAAPTFTGTWGWLYYYGRIFAGQDVAAGSYADGLVLTLNF